MEHWKAIELARQCVLLGRGEGALDALADASPELAETWLWRANALHLLGRYADAIDAARAGLALEPENSFLHYAVARAELMFGDGEAAQAAIVESLRLNPDEPDALATYASVLSRMGRRSEASRVIRRAAELAPEARNVRVVKAMVTEPADDEAAVRISRELLEGEPEGAIEHWWHGRMLIRRGRLRDAADHFARAAALDPTEPMFAAAARISRHWFFWPLRVTSPFLLWLAWYSILPLLLYAASFGGVLWTALWSAVAWSVYTLAYLLAHRFSVTRAVKRPTGRRRSGQSAP